MATRTAALMKISLAGGAVQWAKQFASSAGSMNDFLPYTRQFVAVDSNGDVYLTGDFTVRSVARRRVIRKVCLLSPLSNRMSSGCA